MTAKCESCGRLHETEAREEAAKLTPRLRETLILVAKGMSSRDIAELFGCHTRTVEQHRYRLGQILGIGSPVEMGIFAYRAGLLDGVTP